MSRVIGIAAILVFGAALATGCGSPEDACEDLATAIDKAAMQPGCSAALASDMQQTAAIIADCNPMAAPQQEAQAACFNAVGSCVEDVDDTLRMLQECLAQAGAAPM